MDKTENELIAEFMGATKIHEGQWAERYAFHGEVSNQAYFKEKLLYSTSWDWLMPVVEKIESLGYFPHSQYLRSEKSKRHFFNITDQNHSMISDAFEETKIEAYYKAVVEFIKWYNSQKS